MNRPNGSTIVRRQSNGEGNLPALPVSPLLQRIYSNRQVVSADELAVELRHLPAPTALKGMAKAVALLLDCLRRGAKILIVGDYDADGATSCALAVRALKAMGAADVDFLVPNRFTYGYGLTPEIVAVAARLEPDLLITVDNGISSVEGVAAAKARGIKVLITDHHLAGAELPSADAIVNPNQPGDDFPSKALAGVGVIFYVMLALRAECRRSDWFAANAMADPNLASLLDLVAFGTIADVVPLDRVNRILVEQGLRRIRAGHCCAGINALLQIARKRPERLTTNDVGFALGPRLNAAGRLEDMSLGVRCLLSDDADIAVSMAEQLDRLNRERRTIEAEMEQQAGTVLDALEMQEAALPFGLCMYDESWHQGVIGILASRIRERTHRPVIAFANDSDGVLKGSARSVPGLHIRDALDAVATRQPGLISRFGGHAMAAGLSLEREKLEAFSQAFDAEVRRHLDEADLHGVLHSDGELSEQELTLDVAEQLRTAGPWGQGFPEPVFDGEFEPVTQRVLADRHLKLVLRVPGTDYCLDAIAFNRADAFDPNGVNRLRLVYRLEVNEWRGQRSAQLIVEHLEAV